MSSFACFALIDCDLSEIYPQLFENEVRAEYRRMRIKLNEEAVTISEVQVQRALNHLWRIYSIHYVAAESVFSSTTMSFDP